MGSLFSGWNARPSSKGYERVPGDDDLPSLTPHDHRSPDGATRRPYGATQEAEKQAPGPSAEPSQTTKKKNKKKKNRDRTSSPEESLGFGQPQTRSGKAESEWM